MKLKLSTLLAIIALLFFLYYYYGYMPCVAEEKPIVLQPVPPTPGEDGVTPIDTQIKGFDVGVTSIEGFDVGVTSIEDIDSNAGNTRPDNVMHVDEPVTYL